MCVHPADILGGRTRNLAQRVLVARKNMCHQKLLRQGQTGSATRVVTYNIDFDLWEEVSVGATMEVKTVVGSITEIIWVE